MTDIKRLMKELKPRYLNTRCFLDHESPFQLLVATILSAQCTDKRVNQVTPHLFKKYPTATAMNKASQTEVEKIIVSTGFYRQKAKSIKGVAKILEEKYSGEVPKNIEELVQLPGVGRKTANVVLGSAFNAPAGIVVDTHVKRISYRLGLTLQKDPGKIEMDLNKIIPRKYWVSFPLWLIRHGREICHARNPKCLSCALLPLCPRKGLAKIKKFPKVVNAPL